MNTEACEFSIVSFTKWTLKPVNLALFLCFKWLHIGHSCSHVMFLVLNLIGIYILYSYYDSQSDSWLISDSCHMDWLMILILIPN